MQATDGAIHSSTVRQIATDRKTRFEVLNSNDKCAEAASISPPGPTHSRAVQRHSYKSLFPVTDGVVGGMAQLPSSGGGGGGKLIL